jgi:hypothetical protein
MWCINPELLCKNHLLGEHGEIHKHRHNFVKKHKITNRITPVVQIEPESMEKRHDELVAEMIKRGYNHASPYEQPDISYLKKEERYAKVDLSISLSDLICRCPECAEKINNIKTF